MTERSFARLARKHEIEDEKLIASAVEQISRDPALRLLVWRLLESCGMATSPFTQDPLTTAHRAGMMAVGELLIATLDAHDPAIYPDLMKEQKNAQRQRERDLAQHLDPDTSGD